MLIGYLINRRVLFTMDVCFSILDGKCQHFRSLDDWLRFEGFQHSCSEPSLVVIGTKGWIRPGYWKQKMFTGFISEYFNSKVLEYCGQNHNAVNFIFSVMLITISHYNKNQIAIKVRVQKGLYPSIVLLKVDYQT